MSQIGDNDLLIQLFKMPVRGYSDRPQVKISDIEEAIEPEIDFQKEYRPVSEQDDVPLAKIPTPNPPVESAPVQPAPEAIQNQATTKVVEPPGEHIQSPPAEPVVEENTTSDQDHSNGNQDEPYTEAFEEDSTSQGTSFDDLDSEDKKRRRREILARWGVHYYDVFQGSMSMLGYNYVNNKKELKEREEELLDQVLKGDRSPATQSELKYVRELIEESQQMNDVFVQKVFMPEGLKSDAQELFFDVAEVEGLNVNPWLLLLGVLLITPVLNIVSIFIDRYHNSRITKKMKPDGEETEE